MQRLWRSRLPAAQFDSVVIFSEEPVIVAAKGYLKLASKRVPKCVIVFEHGCPHWKRNSEPRMSLVGLGRVKT